MYVLSLSSGFVCIIYAIGRYGFSPWMQITLKFCEGMHSILESLWCNSLSLTFIPHGFLCKQISLHVNFSTETWCVFLCWQLTVMGPVVSSLSTVFFIDKEMLHFCRSISWMYTLAKPSRSLSSGVCEEILEVFFAQLLAYMAFIVSDFYVYILGT